MNDPQPADKSPDSRERKLGPGGPSPENRTHPFNALTDRFPAENLNPLIHFYRGELSRAIAWRQKMDMTTHWAIISVTALISVCFTSAHQASHIIMVFASALVFLLMNIEGRRYRYYDLWRTRVRMLEVHFVVPSIVFQHKLPEGPWREQLCNDLLKPTYKISYWEAVGRRLQRNYAWLFGISLAAWIAKVYLDYQARPFELQGSWWTSLNVYSPNDPTVVLIPWWGVLTVVAGFHLFLLGLLYFAFRTRNATGEIRRKDPQQRQWPI